MRNLRLDETGRRLTKYRCYIGFYDFSHIQGMFIGTLIKMTGFSRVTHVGPIIQVPGVGDVTITICQGQIKNGGYESLAKIHKEEVLEKSGSRLIHRKYIGEYALDLEETIRLANTYTDSQPWDIIFHQFVGRFLGLTRPRACSSFVCGLFKLKECWHPASLYRKYK